METTISWWNEEVLSTAGAPERPERITPSPAERGCLLYKLVVDGVLSVILSLIGLIGNVLTYLVFWKDRNSSATAYVLIVLAVVDSVVLLTWAPFRGAFTFAQYPPRDARFFNYADAIIQHYGMSFVSTCHLMSTWCVVLVTCVRYIAVCHPERSQRWLAPNVVRKATAIVLSSCVIVIIPRVFSSYVVYDSTRGRLRKVTFEWAKSRLYYYIYPSVVFTLALYIVPLSLIAFCTYKIVRSLAEARKRRQEMTRASRDEHEITFSLVIVIVVFVVCQLALPVNRIWMSLPNANRACQSAYFYYTPVAFLGPIVNSAVNFIIFVLCCKRFKKKVISIIRRKGQVGPWSNNSSLGTDQTASTSGNKTTGAQLG